LKEIFAVFALKEMKENTNSTIKETKERNLYKFREILVNNY